MITWYTKCNFPMDYTTSDLKYIVTNKNNMQPSRRIELALEELHHRKLNHQTTGHYINILA